VQVDHKGKAIRNADGVRAKFGVDPVQIPDFLALVGDAADGYPGIPGIGPATAAQLLKRHQSIENFPATVLGDRHDLALLFKRLATLKTDAPLFSNVDEMRWRGPTAGFAEFAQRLGDARLVERCLRAAAASPAPAGG
jgi:5'-3' exonuclease